MVIYFAVSVYDVYICGFWNLEELDVTLWEEKNLPWNLMFKATLGDLSLPDAFITIPFIPARFLTSENSVTWVTER